MKERILQTLRELRAYALKQGYEISLFYHEEDSYLMRFANSAISLNTNEHLIRLEITAYLGRKRATNELITSLDDMDAMKHGIDEAAKMVEHTQPLSYQPSIPAFASSFEDESACDEELAGLGTRERLEFFNKAAAGLETDELKLSGIFSCGANTVAQISTKTAHTQYMKTSDAQVTAVLSHRTLKWEVTAEQSAQTKADLDAEALHGELAFLVERYQKDAPQQIPLGHYDVIFGAAATADLLSVMNWIGFNGGSLKRGFSFLTEADLGKRVFSPYLTLTDNPECKATFPFRQDLTGINRQPFPIFTDGVFNAFTWPQDDADEFGAQATGHTVMHNSLVIKPGKQPVNTLEQLVSMPRETDILYIPFIHYMNIVNPSKGTITGSSRFGAMLLKAGGGVVIPYNVRLTQDLQAIFGDKVAWLSSETVAYNTSNSYGARNPSAVVVPRFMMVKDLEISHSNKSY